MEKKKKITIKKQMIALFLSGVMVISMLAGLPVTTLTVMAEQSDYGLSNPVLDEENHTVTYDCIYFGHYWQEDTNEDGKADKEDAKTSIKWRVLSVDGDDAFLIADRNLDMQRYNDTYKDEDGNGLDITWEICTMRSWLNGYEAASNICGKDYTGDSFIDNAFSAPEQSAIRNTALANNDNPNCGTEGGKDTTDKLFLLSLEDIANETYGFTNYRNKESEGDTGYGNGASVGKEYYGEGEADYYNIFDYAKLRTDTEFAKGSDTASGDTYTNGIGTLCWWLRSPGSNSNYASYVGDEGYVYYYGYYVNYVSYAVCPALHLNLSSSDVWKPAGTVTCEMGNVGGIADEDGHIHRWDDGIITTNPTLTAEGEKTYTCSVCGSTKTEAVAKLEPSTDYGPSNPVLDKKNHTVTYDCIYFGNYWQKDTNGDDEANKQDDKTPIKWRVLSVDGDDAFLIADQNLDMQRYNDTWLDEDNNYLDITWEICTMRSWLNGYGADSNICEKDYTGNGTSFINSAFTLAEQSAIKDTELENKGNPNYGTVGGDGTMDKLFLLSLEDIANEAYGFTNYRNKKGEDDEDWGNGDFVEKEPYTYYDEYEGKEVESYCNIYDYVKLRTNTVFAKGIDTASGDTYTSVIDTGDWWLRSPGSYSYYASHVDFTGIVFCGNFGGTVENDNYAVCPALHLDLSSSDVWKPAGTVTCEPGNVGGIAGGTASEDGHDHVWDNGTVTTPATCGQEGVKTFTCTVEGCGETRTEEIPATGNHTWDDGIITTNPTETAEGEKIYTCSVCGSTKTEAVAMLEPSTEQTPTSSGETTTPQEQTPASTEQTHTTPEQTPASTEQTPTTPGQAGSETVIGAAETDSQGAEKTVVVYVPSKAPQLEEVFEVYGIRYKITSIDKKTVSCLGLESVNTGSIRLVVPQKIQIDNTAYTIAKIEQGAFANETRIRTVTVGDGVTEIGDSAFENGTGIETLTLGAGVQSVGSRAFYNCAVIRNVTINSGKLKCIDKAAFKNTGKYSLSAPKSSLSAYKKLIKYSDKAKSMIASNGFYQVLNEKKKTAKCVGVVKQTTKVTVPSTVTADGTKYKVTEIGKSAFKNDKKVKKITLQSANLTTIGSSAFQNCKKLKQLTIKSTKLKKVGKNAFKGCKMDVKVPPKMVDKYSKLFKGKW